MDASDIWEDFVLFRDIDFADLLNEVRMLRDRVVALEERLARLRCKEQAPNLPEGVSCLHDLGHEGQHEQRILMGPGQYQVIKWD